MAKGTQLTTICDSNSRGSSALFWTLCAPGTYVVQQTYMQAKQSYTSTKNKEAFYKNRNGGRRGEDKDLRRQNDIGLREEIHVMLLKSVV